MAYLLITLLTFCLMACTIALAAPAEGEFVSWPELTTYAGAVLAVTLITQFVKQIPGVGRVNPQLLAYIVAVIIMIAAEYFNGSLSVSGAVLCLVNAVIVSLAANGAYDATTTNRTVLQTKVISTVEDAGEGR